jgi:LysR family transcriptional regulator, hydrogen peroxide-inducible genes activator
MRADVMPPAGQAMLRRVTLFADELSGIPVAGAWAGSGKTARLCHPRWIGQHKHERLRCAQPTHHVRHLQQSVQRVIPSSVIGKTDDDSAVCTTSAPLVALHDHGHFGRAAEACHITQSTLSGSIKELESLLKVTLVDRSKRRVVLTPVGTETVERARRIVKEVEDLVSFTTASRDPLSGTLRMGTIPTVGPFLLPRVLPSLREAYSRLRLYLVEDLTDRLIESLHRGELDVVLLALPYDCGAVETVILFEDPFVVGLPRTHPLAKEGPVKLQRLWREDLLLLKDGHCLRDHALAACRLADRRLTEGFEATSLATLVQMVDNGLGTTLLPTLAVEAGLLRGTNIVTRPLLSDDPARKIGLIWRRGTGRREEFRLLAKELLARSKLNVKLPALQ